MHLIATFYDLTDLVIIVSSPNIEYGNKFVLP